MTGVSVVGVGARTPVGLGAQASAAAVRAKISRLSMHPFVVDRSGEPMTVAADARLETDVPLLKRLRTLGCDACEEALAPFTGRSGIPAAMHVCMPIPRPGLGDEELRHAARSVTAAASDICTFERVAMHARGHASGALAVRDAIEQILAKEVELAVVVGVDSYLEASGLEWLDDNRRVQHQDNPTGFYPGEAAGALVLCRTGLGRTFGLEEHARLLGCGLAHEEAHVGSEGICVGKGLTAAIERATAPLQLPEQRIGQLWCDINGERYRSEELMYLPLRIWRPVYDFTAYEAPAEAWGDVGAASLPLYVALGVCASMRGWASSPYAMAWAGSDDGTRGAITFELQESQR